VALLFFALLVLFDVLAHLSKDDGRKSVLDKMALGFFAVAVLAEVIAYPYGQRNDTLSERIIGSLDAKAQRATDNASKALTDSSTALAQAKVAADTAGRAKQEADQVIGIATAARSTAENARAGAVDAKRQVGVEYEFDNTFGSGEAEQFLLSINELLKSAGWKRLKSPMQQGTSGVPILDNGEYVAVGIATGVVVRVQYRDGCNALRTLGENRPEYARAAGTLVVLLSSHLYPPDELPEDRTLRCEKGDSQAVHIDVGSKP
jgi:hypothetical protein